MHQVTPRMMNTSQFPNMRSESIEIALAFVGLLFACFSAALIVAFSIPLPKTVVEGVFQSTLPVADTLGPLESKIDLLFMPKMYRVGSQRRLGEIHLEVSVELKLHQLQPSTQTV
jgi:hypothetical protein